MAGDDDPDLSASVHDLYPFHASRSAGHGVDEIDPVEVKSDRLPACTGAATADGVTGGDDMSDGSGHGLIVVVSADGIGDHLVFSAASSHFGSEDRVGPLMVVGHGFADVVEQAPPPGGGDIKAKLFGHHPGEVTHLNGVFELILGVAEAKFESTHQFENLGMNAAELEHADGFARGVFDFPVNLGGALLRNGANFLGAGDGTLCDLAKAATGYLAGEGVVSPDKELTRLGVVVEDAGDLMEERLLGRALRICPRVDESGGGQGDDALDALKMPNPVIAVDSGGDEAAGLCCGLFLNGLVVCSKPALGAELGCVDSGRDEFIPEGLSRSSALLLEGVNAAGVGFRSLLSHGACPLTMLATGNALLLEGFQVGVLLVTAGVLEGFPEVDFSFGLSEGLKVLFAGPLQLLPFGDAKRCCGGVVVLGVFSGLAFRR